MIHVQNNHFGRPASLATGLDHARRSVGCFHKGDRTGCGTAASQLFFGGANFGKVDPGTRPPFENNALFPIPIEDRIHSVFDREDKARRTLRFLFNTAVKPDRAVKTGLLVQQNMG